MSDGCFPPPDSPFGSVVREAFRAEGLDLPRAVITSLLPLRTSLLSTGRFLTMVPQIVSTSQLTSGNSSACRCHYRIRSDLLALSP